MRRIVQSEEGGERPDSSGNFLDGLSRELSLFNSPWIGRTGVQLRWLTPKGFAKGISQVQFTEIASAGWLADLDVPRGFANEDGPAVR